MPSLIRHCLESLLGLTHLPQDSLEVAKQIKQQFCYVCPDLAKEFSKYDKSPEKYFKEFSGAKASTPSPYHTSTWLIFDVIDFCLL